MKATIIRTLVIASALGALGRLAVSHADPIQASQATATSGNSGATSGTSGATSGTTGSTTGTEGTTHTTGNNTTIGTETPASEPNRQLSQPTQNTNSQQQQQDSGCCGMGGSNSNG